MSPKILLDTDKCFPHSMLSCSSPGPTFHLKPFVITEFAFPKHTKPQPYLDIISEILIT